VGPKGQRPLLPKSEGDGYMLSAFVSREFGVGRGLSKEELDKVNGERRGANKTYINKQTAIEFLKSAQKPLLTESPFVKYTTITFFRWGINLNLLMSGLLAAHSSL
jgi:hypothetical protein